MEILNKDLNKDLQLDETISSKLVDSLNELKEKIKIFNMDNIDRSFYIFNPEGKINEMSSDNEDSNNKIPLSNILNEDNLKIFKDSFIIEKLIGNIKNGNILNMETLKKFENISNLKVNLDIEDSQEPLFTIEGTKLKINLNLERSQQVLDRGVDFIKTLPIADLSVSGNIIPTLGSYMFYRKISDLYAKHLLESLNKCPSANKMAQAKINNQSLLIFNLFAGLTTAITFSGATQAIKNTAKINISSIFSSGDNIESNSNIFKSIIPFIIVNKIKKIPN